MPSVTPDLVSVLACPECGGALLAHSTTVDCIACSRSFEVAGGIPNLRRPLERSADEVRAFYSLSPFPAYPERDTYIALRTRARRSAFGRLLDESIPPDATIADVGCGTGQLSLFLATGERLVVGADLTRASLQIAVEAARRFGVERAHFVEADLRRPGLRPGAFDVVISSGVIHHTPDPESSFHAVARLARPGGVIIVGLYNAYARIPHRLRRAVARLTGFRWIPLDPVLRDRASDPARRRAWLRDQYHHPEEHRHTLSEVQRWFEAGGISYLRAYPSTITAAPALDHGGLFEPAVDNWPFENVVHQMSWSCTIGREGGLFVVIGRVRERSDR